jgi:hypothetical protein
MRPATAPIAVTDVSCSVRSSLAVTAARRSEVGGKEVVLRRVCCYRDWRGLLAITCLQRCW